MQAKRLHHRIIEYPFARLMHGARLDSYYELEQDLVLDVQGLQVESSELIERDDKLYERVTGSYVPLRVRFSNVNRLYRDDFFTVLENYERDDPSRTIVHLLSWRQPEETDIYHRMGLYGPADGTLYFFAQSATCETRDKPQQAVTIERDWAPAPPMPQRLVPHPWNLYKQFGGDPVTIKVNGKVRHQKLFISGIDIQPKRRPQVDAVLNLGEEPSRWVKGEKLHRNDRAINHGEGMNGMTVAQICEEAEWVIERLKQNQRVLVHCVAGMNRSTTVCCATLMLLEGLSAEAALARVREHHPWARPDSRHWLTLRSLEKISRGLA